MLTAFLAPTILCHCPGVQCSIKSAVRFLLPAVGQRASSPGQARDVPGHCFACTPSLPPSYITGNITIAPSLSLCTPRVTRHNSLSLTPFSHLVRLVSFADRLSEVRTSYPRSVLIAGIVEYRFSFRATRHAPIDTPMGRTSYLLYLVPCRMALQADLCPLSERGKRGYSSSFPYGSTQTSKQALNRIEGQIWTFCPLHVLSTCSNSPVFSSPSGSGTLLLYSLSTPQQQKCPSKKRLLTERTTTKMSYKSCVSVVTGSMLADPVQRQPQQKYPTKKVWLFSQHQLCKCLFLAFLERWQGTLSGAISKAHRSKYISSSILFFQLYSMYTPGGQL